MSTRLHSSGVRHTLPFLPVKAQKCKEELEERSVGGCPVGDLVDYIAANYTRRAELLSTQRSYISPGLRGTAGNVSYVRSPCCQAVARSLYHIGRAWWC